jgi:hypothetical protein
LALKYSLQTAEAREALEKSSDTELKTLLRPFMGPLSSLSFDPFVLTKDSNVAGFDAQLFAR